GATFTEGKNKADELTQAEEILSKFETDKVVLEVPAPASGVLSEIVKANGSTVTSGDVLARIDSEAKASAAAPAAAAEEAAPAAAPAAAAPAASSAASSVASPAAAKILA